MRCISSHAVGAGVRREPGTPERLGERILLWLRPGACRKARREIPGLLPLVPGPSPRCELERIRGRRIRRRGVPRFLRHRELPRRIPRCSEWRADCPRRCYAGHTLRSPATHTPCFAGPPGEPATRRRLHLLGRDLGQRLAPRYAPSPDRLLTAMGDEPRNWAAPGRQPAPGCPRRDRPSDAGAPAPPVRAAQAWGAAGHAVAHETRRSDVAFIDRVGVSPLWPLSRASSETSRVACARLGHVPSARRRPRRNGLGSLGHLLRP